MEMFTNHHEGPGTTWRDSIDTHIMLPWTRHCQGCLNNKRKKKTPKNLRSLECRNTQWNYYVSKHTKDNKVLMNQPALFRREWVGDFIFFTITKTAILRPMHVKTTRTNGQQHDSSWTDCAAKLPMTLKGCCSVLCFPFYAQPGSTVRLHPQPFTLCLAPGTLAPLVVELSYVQRLQRCVTAADNHAREKRTFTRQMVVVTGNGREPT